MNHDPIDLFVLKWIDGPLSFTKHWLFDHWDLFRACLLILVAVFGILVLIHEKIKRRNENDKRVDGKTKGNERA